MWIEIRNMMSSFIQRSESHINKRTLRTQADAFSLVLFFRNSIMWIWICKPKVTMCFLTTLTSCDTCPMETTMIHPEPNVTSLSNASTPFHHHMNNAVLGILLGTLSLLTVIMNLLVLFAVRKERSLHTVGNLYIVSLSIADLIVGRPSCPWIWCTFLRTSGNWVTLFASFWLVMDYGGEHGLYF